MSIGKRHRFPCNCLDSAFRSCIESLVYLCLYTSGLLIGRFHIKLLIKMKKRYKSFKKNTQSFTGKLLVVGLFIHSTFTTCIYKDLLYNMHLSSGSHIPIVGVQ